jgi:hypothetical protein
MVSAAWDPKNGGREQNRQRSGLARVSQTRSMAVCCCNHADTTANGYVSGTHPAPCRFWWRRSQRLAERSLGFSLLALSLAMVSTALQLVLLARMVLVLWS